MSTSPDLAVPELAGLEVKGHTRSAFLLRSALAAGAVYGAGTVSPFVRQAFAQGGGDVAILNFALTLEHLEAEFYAEAMQKVTGLDAETHKLVEQLAKDEAAHVDALTAAVKDAGGKPAAKPTLAFGDAFSSTDAFLKTANTLEDTGVSAYNGAAPMIQSIDVLGAAGSIVQVEARHAALIRLTRGRPPAPLAFDKPSDKAAVLKAVTPFIQG